MRAPCCPCLNKCRKEKRNDLKLIRNWSHSTARHDDVPGCTCTVTTERARVRVLSCSPCRGHLLQLSVGMQSPLFLCQAAQQLWVCPLFAAEPPAARLPGVLNFLLLSVSRPSSLAGCKLLSARQKQPACNYLKPPVVERPGGSSLLAPASRHTRAAREHPLLQPEHTLHGAEEIQAPTTTAVALGKWQRKARAEAAPVLAQDGWPCSKKTQATRPARFEAASITPATPVLPESCARRACRQVGWTLQRPKLQSVTKPLARSRSP